MRSLIEALKTIVLFIISIAVALTGGFIAGVIFTTKATKEELEKDRERQPYKSPYYVRKKKSPTYSDIYNTFMENEKDD